MLSYLDAGTFNAAAAAVAGGVAGVAVVGRMYGRRALGIVSKKHRVDSEYTPDRTAESDADTPS